MTTPTDEQRLFQLLVESSYDGIAAFGVDRRFTVWSPAMERITSVPPDDVIGRSVLEVFPHIAENGGLAQIERALEGEIVTIAERPYVVPQTGRKGFCEGVIAPIRDETGAVAGACSIIRDTTAQRELHEQLRHSQRMEAMGQLAGGVAHDFNNLLTAIRGFSELLARRLENEPVGLRYASEVTKAADQAAALVHQLLAFARREMAQPRELDLDAVISGSEEMLGRLAGETVRVVIRPSRSCAWVRADPGEIEQILLNLTVNARDAMPGGGALTIETSTLGDEVVLAVSDDGLGMDDDTLAHAFEPFFTTKPVGYGTGLGLATVYGIVERSSGRIETDSEPGRGTTIRISLPRVEPTPGAAQIEPPDRTAREPATILLVEDAPAVRDVTRAILERAGYQVLEAAEGESALDLVRGSRERVDLVLSDVVMPGISGQELAARITELDPDTRIVLMSGYTDTLSPDAPEGSALLPKPYTAEALLARLADELGPAHRPSTGLTCVVADDHPSILLAVSEALAARGIEIVAEARDGGEALARIEALSPRIAIVDVRMPGLDGIELARRVASVAPRTAVIVYSGYAERGLVDRALAAGARGFVLKGAPLADLGRAVELVASGDVYVDPQLAALDGAADPPRLTRREQEVLRLAADGMTNVDIAAELCISSETVQTHVRKAMTKLDAESRTQAVAKALRKSLIA